ncbi:MAG TPA: type VI secretion system tube protein Hcp [Blastocatellia bacterium]|nr:type VI secretion system tube protein Hcp [Blastocatellia bacterium]
MAQTDYFLKLEGIEGESTDAKHKGEIDVLSWSWGETNTGGHTGGAGHGAGKVQMQDFNFAMRVSKASPKLLLACASGEHIKKAVLTCRRAGKEQQEYLIVTYTDCIVSSYQTGGSAGDVVPVDQISLNYSQINYEYKEQKQDGTLGGAVPAGWNLKENKAV